MVDHSVLYACARKYVSQMRKRLRIIRSLGFGQDGHVWATNQRTAIKAYERLDNYRREVACYQRLAENNIQKIEIFITPKLLGQDEELRVIEMSIVPPPYFLDFGKAHLDQPFDFEAGAYEEWEEDYSSRYEPDQWPIVKQAIAQLQLLGIYYYDAKPHREYSVFVG